MEDIINMFLPEEDNHTISTLVFMDLEATGLPSFAGKKSVHITEISLIAIDRNTFETDKSLRVLNKLSLCIQPRSLITPGAMSITGLYNDVLESQETFDESIPKLLKYFFRRLKSPVCLLAHNGRRYDFPLLQAELKRINYTLGPEVLCVDTLEALRSILNPAEEICCIKGNEINKTKNGNNVTLVGVSNVSSSSDKEITKNGNDATLTSVSNIKNSSSSSKEIITSNENDITPQHILNIESLSSSSDEEIDSLLSKDIELFNDIDSTITNIPTAVGDTDENVLHSENPKDIASKNEHTPQSKIIGIPVENKFKRGKTIDPDRTFSPKKQCKPKSISNSLTDVKRKLFETDVVPNGNDISVPKPKLSFSLPKLYHRFFGEDPPVSHYAEADCIALSKVCQKVNQKFLQWIDKNSFPFNEIEEMW